MSFMQLQITKKGHLYCADCAKCGTTIYSHEWATWDNNNARDALQDGTARCDQCSGQTDPETFTDCGMQYACRFSAPGYLDSTEWNYGKNRRKLEKEVRDLYGAY